MQKQLEQYFGCKVKIAEYKNKLQLPIFMTMRDIMMVEIYGVNFAIIDVVKEMELSVAAMKKQKAKYEEALQCPAAYEVALNSVSMRNVLVKSGVPFVDLLGNVFLSFTHIHHVNLLLFKQDTLCYIVPSKHLIHFRFNLRLSFRILC